MSTTSNHMQIIEWHGSRTKQRDTFKNTAYEVCWCTFAYSYLDSAPFGYSFATKKSLLSNGQKRLFWVMRSLRNVKRTACVMRLRLWCTPSARVWNASHHLSQRSGITYHLFASDISLKSILKILKILYISRSQRNKSLRDLWNALYAWRDASHRKMSAAGSCRKTGINRHLGLISKVAVLHMGRLFEKQFNICYNRSVA